METAIQKIPAGHFSSGDDSCWDNSSDLSKQRNEVFDMSRLYNATQKAEDCMEFPPIKWSSEGDEEEEKGISAQRCASYTYTFLGATDTIQPALLVRPRCSSTSSLRKRGRSSKQGSASRFLVRSIAMNANLSLLESPGSTKNATFTREPANSPFTAHSSRRLEECMKILKGSELLSPQSTRQEDSFKKQRSIGSFHH
jgi:hypothetical protein